MSRSRSLAAALAVLAAVGVPAALSAPAGAAAPPADEAALSKVVVALDGPLTSGLREALTDLGVVRGIELRSIGAVAVTAPAEVVAELPELPGVRAVVPQRRIRL